MKRSLSASNVHGAYIDEATKRAILGAHAATSFGLPLSNAVVFKASALDEGPVVLVEAVPGAMIIPMYVLAFVGDKLDANLSANLGWPAPPPPEPVEGVEPEPPTEHDEPWLNATPVLWYGGEENGSLVTLPNATAQPSGRVWPECVINRPFALETAAGVARGKKKALKQEEKDEALAETRLHEGKEVPLEVEPDLTIVTFYTVA